MAREIKFRAWDEEAKAWVPAVRLFEALSWLSSDDQTVFFDEERTFDLVIEQFTGQLDRNGKKIWEGDVVQDKKTSAFGSVKWLKTSFQIVNGRERWTAFSSRLPHLEVIGNIHQNPELL